MMYASLHCTDYAKTRMDAEWRRKHSGEPVDTQDYFTVQVETDHGQVTLFMTPEQLDTFTTKLQQAGNDRQVVLIEEMRKPAPLELARGAEEGVVKGGDGPVRQTWRFGRRE